MKTFFEMLGFTFLCILYWCLMFRCTVSGVFYDDLEFYRGNKSIWKRRKAVKGFWKKFFFLDIRNDVVLWHYVLFCICCVLAVLIIAAGNLYILSGHKIIAFRIVALITFAIFFFGELIFTLDRWTLYWPNKVRNRKEWKEKHEKRRKKRWKSRRDNDNKK